MAITRSESARESGKANGKVSAGGGIHYTSREAVKDRSCFKSNQNTKSIMVFNGAQTQQDNTKGMGLLKIIADCCNEQARMKSCQTSKTLRNAPTPHVYQMRISAQATGKMGFSSPDASFTLNDFGSKHGNDPPPGLVRRQKIFIRTLTERMELDRFVQTVSGTILPIRRDWEEGPGLFHPSTRWLDHSGQWKPLSSIWPVLGRLDNIRYFGLV